MRVGRPDFKSLFRGLRRWLSDHPRHRSGNVHISGAKIEHGKEGLFQGGKGPMMLRIFISCVVSAMLAGCASPYHSMRDSGAGYGRQTAYVHSSAWVDPAWYPWWSVDYFYLGDHYYRPIFGPAYSFGMSFGYPWSYPFYFSPYYSAWYDPYRFYDPWFVPYYGWRPTYGLHRPYWPHQNSGHGWPPDHGHSNMLHPEPVGYSRDVPRGSSGPRRGGQRGMVVTDRYDGMAGSGGSATNGGYPVAPSGMSIKAENTAPAVRGYAERGAAPVRRSNPSYSAPAEPAPKVSGYKRNRH